MRFRPVSTGTGTDTSHGSAHHRSGAGVQHGLDGEAGVKFWSTVDWGGAFGAIRTYYVTGLFGCYAVQA